MSDANSPTTELDDLINGLLDKQLDDAQSARLSTMLTSDAGARQRYIEYVQLHVDLEDYFLPAKRKQAIADVAKKLGAPLPAIVQTDVPLSPGIDATTG